MTGFVALVGYFTQVHGGSAFTRQTIDNGRPVFYYRDCMTGKKSRINRKAGRKKIGQAAKGSGGVASPARPYGKIFINKEGKWFHEGVEITHERTLELFSRSIVKDPAGGYLLQVGAERAKIEVEDTPYIVRSVEFNNGSVMLELNDKSSETLDPGSLQVGQKNVLYCRVKSGEFPARFLRPAYYQLMTRLEQDSKGFYLEIGGSKHYLRT